MSTDSSTLFPQEIWDEIVDQIAGFEERMHMADLRSASLASRCFVPRAQSYIFRSLSIETVNGTEPGVLAERLLNTMTCSPHLIPHVHDLHVYMGDVRSLSAVAQIPWSHVYHLTLGSMAAAAGSIVLAKVATLIGLPSLRGLVFRIGRWDATHLCNIFASCTDVKRLTFVQCFSSPLAVPFTPPAMPTTLARPTSLFLSASNPTIDLLLEPTCPLDLSGVTHIKFVQFDSRRINALFSRIGDTLTHLYIHGHDPKLDDLDVELVPHLTHIDASTISEPFTRLLGRLPATNRVEEITIPSGITRGNSDFESAIVERRMPALRRVIVQVSGIMLGMQDGIPREPAWQESVRRIEMLLPRLYESGVLRVVSVPFRGPSVFW
ncbi:hypothetical protein FB45DRAFT_1041872 [Roridomyces roridus]|uniref:Uncharacterized protein n=1 Tax=Roridomyces roridus TaxID=1738132 RepID=A0AAD7AZP1_9AGAR|nr:hypothetical protein FB45DRAFT_1041872 [Roridomyces roridus]